MKEYQITVPEQPKHIDSGQYIYIFDLGGVLVNYDSDELAALLAKANNCDLEAVARLFTHELLYQVESGRISGPDFYTEYVSRVLPKLSYEDWINVFENYFTLNPVGLELLLELKQKGRKVYILSNLAEFHKIAIERKIPGIFDHCQYNFFSYEMGYHKPELEIFRKLCDTIGEKPENCVFFDDLPKNIEGAQKAGMKGILFSNDRIAQVRHKVNKLEAEG